ncbi:histidine phosphatase family protein [Streptomyces sp. SID9913]|uniref:histidine phosphatase family protein n=1 Tax=Streptomyces sp. SID9913 TaxID=2706117 RepID=UPI0013D97BC4|nr:histidine phosphatase family protein [Streptomyces sp. SID9913]NED20624.1 histidine phosphatase family protein [Streptomyces sp. SID9913]
MTIRLTLLCAPPADTVFRDAPPSERALRGAGAAVASLPAHAPAMRSPSSGSALTAAALGLKAAVEPALRDLDCGTWRGRTVADIAAADPYGYSAWLTDPDAAPHGGETVRELCRRIAHWLSALPPDTGRALAIAEPAVVRALLVHAWSAPVRAFRTLRVPPLYTVSLTWRDGVWGARPADTSCARGLGRPPALPLTALTAPRRTVSDRGPYLCGERAA